MLDRGCVWQDMHSKWDTGDLAGGICRRQRLGISLEGYAKGRLGICLAGYAVGKRMEIWLTGYAIGARLVNLAGGICSRWYRGRQGMWVAGYAQQVGDWGSGWRNMQNSEDRASGLRDMQ